MPESSVSLYTNWFCWTQRPHHLAAVLSGLGLEPEIFSMRTARARGPAVRGARLATSCIYPRPFTSFAAFRRWNARKRQRLADRFFQADARCQIFAAAPMQAPRTYSSSAYRVYDCMDDWAGFPGADGAVREWERELCEWADRIWAVSRKLAARLGEEFPGKVEYVPNGVEYEHFNSVPGLRDPAPRRPRLGYIGALDSWFDVELVREVACALQDWTVVLVGPDRFGPDRRARLSAPNIEHLGRIPYEELPRIMATFDVAMIPFKLTSLIEATSPIKLFEYMAAGLPVVSTPMPEVIPFAEPGVLACCETARDFERAVRDLKASGSPLRSQQIAERHSWRARFEKPLNHILPAAAAIL